MKKIKITVMRKARYDDLIDKYENPIEHACGLEEGFSAKVGKNQMAFVTVRGTAFHRSL